MTDKSARRIAAIFVTVAAMVVCGFALGRMLRRAPAHVDVDRARYPVVGIDISAHNGIVVFDSIADAGIDFVFIKASEGESFRDSLFTRNFDNATAAGIPAAPYHFFRFECDGRLQAQNLIDAIGERSPALPVAIDIEEWGNKANVATDVIVGRLQAMEAELRSAGFSVIIYTNKNGFRRFYVPAFGTDGSGPDLWICSFTNPPMVHSGWQIWQHSHHAHIPGVNGHVDLNTFNGSRQQFIRRYNLSQQP